MRKVRSFSLVLCVALVGCHSESDATNENFAVGIQGYLDRLPGACVGSPAQTIPFSLSKQDSGLGGSPLVRARGLEAAGLITSDATVKQDAGSANVDTLTFSLTDQGKKYFSQGTGIFPQFCGGKRKLHGIQNAQVVKSPTGTRALIAYGYDLVDQPSWMKNSTLRTQYPDLDPQRTLNDQTVLTLTSAGWTF
jgi:hypothetical protein